MSEPKQYLGNGREMSGNFGPFFKISFSKADLDKMYAALNAKGYTNLIMSKRREPSQYGDTESIYIDTWVPQGGQAPAQHAPYQPAPQTRAYPETMCGMPVDQPAPGMAPQVPAQYPHPSQHAPPPIPPRSEPVATAG